MPLAVSQAEISIEILIQRKSASFLQVKDKLIWTKTISAPVHNVYFVQSDAPVSFKTLYSIQ